MRQGRFRLVKSLPELGLRPSQCQALAQVPQAWRVGPVATLLPYSVNLCVMRRTGDDK
jgi:hypothetical protein